VSATKNKRKASELGFSIPPAKRPEPEEYSVTESESDFDDVSPSCLPASTPTLAQSKDITTHCDTDLCSPQLLIDFLGGFSPEDDSVTESDSDDGLPEETVGDYSKANPADALVLDAKHHIRVPPSLSKHLRSYQREGVQFLFQRYILGRGVILGDDMGLGKTIQVISFLSALMRKSGTPSDRERRRNRVSQLQDGREWRDGRKLPPPDDKWPTALIVAPSSVVSVWTREFDKVNHSELNRYG
jgi:SNF2 family DNA or RNA helicase